MVIRNVQNAIRGTYENAERFLKDSEILQKEGSIGHATSLAILGYEEAQKAYELTKFHSFFEGIYTLEYLEELETQLMDHTWKHILAKQYRIGIEAMIASGAIPDTLLDELGVPSVKELQEATELTLFQKLNKMKNDGLYVNASRNPLWIPSDMKTQSLEFTQKILRIKLDEVHRVVEVMSSLDKFPKEKVEMVSTIIAQLQLTLQKADNDNLKDLEELDKRLSKFGEIGTMVSHLARAFINDDRFQRIRKEQRKKKWRRG